VAGYGRDLAHAHLTGHSDFVRLAAPAVLGELSQAGIHSGLVVDLGCGTGILADVLLRAGYDVVGVDLSTDMVEIARRTAPGAAFVAESFFDVALPACAAVTCVGQSFGYAFDPRNSLAALGALFERIARVLEPGGLLVFDLNTPAALVEERFSRDTPDWTIIVECGVSGIALTRDITLFRKVDDAYRRSDERHVVLCHEPASVLDLLAANGFTATTFDEYDGTVLTPGLIGYRAIRS
jgi:SAM-dependent methyltransferase